MTESTERAFDPLKDNDPSNTEEAVALALAWASGKRSWTNTLYYLERDRQHEVCAVMDAQEVVKFTALAQMFSRLEADAKASPERESEEHIEFDPHDLVFTTFRSESDLPNEEGSGVMLTHKPSGAQVATSGRGSMLEKRERLLQQLREVASVQPDGSVVIDFNL